MPEEAPRRPHTAFHAFCQGRQLNPRVAAEEWAQMSAAEKKVRNPILSMGTAGSRAYIHVQTGESNRLC